MDQMKHSVELLCASRTYEDSWKGGRGQLGPLGRWMVLQQDSIAKARGAVIPHGWPALTALAVQDGVRRANGKPYSVDAVRGTWSRIVRRRARLEAPKDHQTAALQKKAMPSRSASSTDATANNSGLIQPITAEMQLPVRRFRDGR